MNYATLYSLKCLFEGGGVLLAFDIYIYICQNMSHIHTWYQTDQHMTEDYTKYINRIYSSFLFIQTNFYEKCNECNENIVR